MRKRLFAALFALVTAFVWLSPHGVLYACGSVERGPSKCCCPPETHIDLPGDSRVERPECEPDAMASPAPQGRVESSLAFGEPAPATFSLVVRAPNEPHGVLGVERVRARGPPGHGPPLYLRHRSILI